jgi:hypothetical protein
VASALISGLGTSAPASANDPPEWSTPVVPLHAVKRLISDHAHDDHVGALAKIKQDTGAEFFGSAGDKWALEHGRVRGSPSPRPRLDLVSRCRTSL